MNRKPNWDKWKLIPDAYVWQVVALSLDIDPDTVTRGDTDWMAGGSYVNREGQEFQDRLDIIRANYREIDPVPKAISMNGIAYFDISIANFAYWAISKKIVIPDEMKDLAKCPEQVANLEQRLFDENDATYPFELDLAVKAWQVVSKSQGKGKPKIRIRAWLDENTSLSDAAKERISVVANWHKTGGAPRTD